MSDDELRAENPIAGGKDELIPDASPGTMNHPALGRGIYWDRSFIGMVVTQFLGAFNDNFFKQLVLFVCVALAKDDRASNLQGIATILFSAPFILMSGYCGYLSDLYSKRTIVILSKVLEIVVMVMGLGAFLVGNVYLMLGVLFLMGAQSALFGPSKYGILPELFSDRDLPQVNGAMLMTTFLAIILGFTAAGEAMSQFGDRVWVASLVAIGIAVVGTLTSLLIRYTPVARPGMKFHASALILSKETRSVLFQDRRLLTTLLVSSLFWTAGGVVYPPAINDLGGLQFKLDEAAVGRLAACTGIGIAIGCLIGGALSRNRFNAKLVRFGAIGMLVGMIALGLPGAEMAWLGVRGSAAALIWLGMCAGIFTVPLQVYLQAKTPTEHKGRIIGAMNLANWIGIASAGLYYHLLNLLFDKLEIPPNVMFLAAALIVLPIVLFYHPQSENLAGRKN